MFFKKKKIIVQKNKPKKTIVALTFLWAMCIFSLWIFVVWAVNTMNFNVFDFTWNTWTWANTSIRSFPISFWWDKQKSDKTIYILLTGRGGWKHDAPDLTDTLIIAWINPINQSISMLSVPRDLYVQYPGSTRKWRINGIYEANLNAWEDIAIWKLKEKLWEVTGREIDYYLNVDFQGFIEIVDTLGWVELTLENNFVDYEYPDGSWWYKSFILRKWTWNLDGEVALMYARSRHSTSDFDRSLRQQKIISSLRTKVWELWYFKDRKKIVELYNIFTQYIETDMSLANMVSIGLEIRSWDETKTISFNLNDTCYSGSTTCAAGWFLYLPIRDYFGGASVLLTKWSDVNNLDEFEDIIAFSDLIYDTPGIYTDPKEIIIYNTTRIPLYAWGLADILAPYGFLIDKQLGAQSYRKKEFENSILYYNGIDSDDATLLGLQKLLNIQIQQRESPYITGSTAKIEIFLADDDSF